MRKLLLAALAAGGVLAYRRVSRPSTSPASPTPTAPATPGSPVPHPIRREDGVLPGDDQGGSSPDEAAADLASEAETHAVTLPDAPLEEVDLSEVPDPEPPRD